MRGRSRIARRIGGCARSCARRSGLRGQIVTARRRCQREFRIGCNTIRRTLTRSRSQRGRKLRGLRIDRGRRGWIFAISDLFEPGLQFLQLRAIAGIESGSRAAAVRRLRLREDRAAGRIMAIDELQHRIQIALRESLCRVEPRRRPEEHKFAGRGRAVAMTRRTTVVQNRLHNRGKAFERSLGKFAQRFFEMLGADDGRTALSRLGRGWVLAVRVANGDRLLRSACWRAPQREPSESCSAQWRCKIVSQAPFGQIEMWRGAIARQPPQLVVVGPFDVGTPGLRLL